MTLPLSRRRFLSVMGTLAGAAALGPLSGCSGSGSASKDGPATTAGLAPTGSGGARGSTVKVSTWPVYVDKALLPVLEAKAGITLDYVEDYNDNNEYFAKVQPQLSNAQSIDRDIVVPTYWMASRWISLGWAQKLPMAQIPNAVHLRPDLVKPSWDPTGEFTLPWANVGTVIGYNRKLVGGDLTSINDLLDPRLKGKITMLTELRDTLGLMLLASGLNPATFTVEEAHVTFDIIDKAKRDGQIRAFTGNDYLQDLSAGNVAACFAYSGDIFQLAKENPDIVLLIPEEGAILETDVMLVPKTSTNPKGAAAFMDFFYDPINAAKVTATTGYISPVAGMADELRKLGAEAAKLADSPAVNPSPAQLAKYATFRPLSEDEEATLDGRFSKIVGA